MRFLKRAKQKADLILAKADRTMTNSEALTEALLEMADEGVIFEVKLFGFKLPLQIVAKPYEEVQDDDTKS